jgi:hypothetical protein
LRARSRSLDLAEPARVELQLGRRVAQRGQRLFGLQRRPFDRGQCRSEASGGLLGDPPERAARIRKLRFRARLAAVAFQRGDGRGHGRAQLLGVHQQAALFGEPRLLAGRRLEGVQLRDRMAQERLVPARRLDRLGRPVARRAGIAPLGPQGCHAARRLGAAAIGVEQGAVAGRIEEAALLELALNLDQGIAEPAQQADRNRLVVDIGSAAPVGAEQAAQHQQIVLGLDLLLVQDRPCRVPGPELEGGGDRGLLGAGAQQPGVGTGAEREPQRVEQDRLAGAGFPGQHAESALER